MSTSSGHRIGTSYPHCQGSLYLSGEVKLVGILIPLVTQVILQRQRPPSTCSFYLLGFSDSVLGNKMVYTSPTEKLETACSGTTNGATLYKILLRLK